MKIAYKKKHIRQSLYFSIMWFVLGVFQFFLMRDQWWLGLGWVLLAAIYLLVYLYQKKEMYITITDKYIKENKPFGKQINVPDITEIKYFSEDYIIYSKDGDLRINTNFIDEKSIEVVEERLLVLVNKKMN